MKRLLNSLLKTFGFLTIILGLTIAILTYGYLVVLGVVFISVGLLLYLIDYFISRFLKDRKRLWIAQITLTLAYLFFAALTYLTWQEHNEIIFPKNYKGQAGIIFGIEGYPKLPETTFWKKIIEIPDSGIIITSTKVEDIPNSLQYSFQDNSVLDINKINWDPNYEYDCIVCDSKVKAWLFTVDNKETSIVKDKITEICNDIINHKMVSSYKSEFSAITTDEKGKYLWLQDRGLTSLPNGLHKLDIYKVILTGNNFTEIPQQIFEITSLEDLIFAVNPITEFPCDLSRLKRIKSVSFTGTQIKDIKCDLSQLDSLEDFDIASNGLTKLPEQIKNIPNLTSLTLNNNQFSDISFVDIRLKKLETLYLHKNRIKSISSDTRFLENLKELLIFDNEIDSISDNISNLKNLETLEIWNNPIKFISPKIAKLTKLKSIRLDDDYLTKADKENLKKWLPNCEINYQTRREKSNAL